jgi:hypothetical protein
MKKLQVLFTVLMLFVGTAIVVGQADTERMRTSSGNMNHRERAIANQGLDHTYANEIAIALRATLADPTFTGTVTSEGPASFEDDVTMDSTLTVAFAASFEDDVTMDSTLTVALGASFGDDVTMDSTLTVFGITQTPTVTEYTTIVTIDSTMIAGTASGDLAHADGHVLVAAAGAGYALEFVSAFIIYDHATADFAGGGDDLVVQVGVNGAQVAMSSAFSQATLLTGSADAMMRVSAIATETVYSDAGIISLFAGTELTNDGGTAAGLLRVHITYRVHTTGL